MHDNALTKRAAVLFPQLGRFESFYLVGGTALALQIGHRVSIDFDLFSERELPHGLLQKIKRVFPEIPLEVTYQSSDQLNLLLDEVKTTFFHYPYPVLEPLVRYQEVPMASILEIAAMKAFAIGKRLAYKDYVDWYFLLSKRHVVLRDVIRLAKSKFRDEFNDRLFLGQLASLADISHQKIDFLAESVDRSTIEATLREQITNLV